nr:MAG TPA: hypothetical protein [Caudoviricetes sp.]
MSKWSLEVFKENMEISVYNYKKKEPLIMVATGLIGFCITAALAYKAKDKVNAIVEDIEALRANDIPVPVGETIVRTTKALSPAIIAGTLSTAAILRSYHVLTGRNALLASALASATQANHRLRKQIREQYPDDPNAQFIGQREEVLAGPEEEGKKNPKTVSVISPDEIQWMEYTYFNKSSEFYKEDLNYNQMFIASVDNALNQKLMRQGFLTLTTVYDALKIPLTKPQRRAGSELGWTDSNPFSLDTHVVMVKDENGYAYPVPVIEFDPVRDITSSVDFASDISDYFI